VSASTAKFNLRPQERRLLVFVAIVVFVVLNIWLVWPHFGDWGRLQMDRYRAQKTLDTYLAETAKMKAYQVRLRELEKEGSSVVPEEQELDLVRTVDRQALLAHLTVLSEDTHPRVTQSTQTNRFFEEQYETIHVSADNEQLINFLVSLTSSNSLIRVKNLTLKLFDASGTKLDGQLTLVASYQRSAPAKGSPARSPATVATVAPTPKPLVPNPSTKTNNAATAKLASTLTNKMALPKSRLTNQPTRKP
jgi:hypothetical protein